MPQSGDPAERPRPSRAVVAAAGAGAGEAAGLARVRAPVLPSATRPVSPPPRPAAPPPSEEADVEVEPEPSPDAIDIATTGAAPEAGLAATGISGLDAQYGGGIPNGNLYLLTSDPTTATSVFLAQYAAAGLSAGERVYYFSLEQPADVVKRAIATFVDDPKMLERLRIIDGYPLQFQDAPPEVRKRIGVSSGENVLRTLESLLASPNLQAPCRVLVESVSDLLTEHEPARVFKVLRMLRAVMRALPSSAVATMVEPLHDVKTLAEAKHLADGVIEFHVERKGFGIYPYIAVTKMRGMSGSARLLLFKETDAGLWLESTKRVF